MLALGLLPILLTWNSERAVSRLYARLFSTRWGSPVVMCGRWSASLDTVELRSLRGTFHPSEGAVLDDGAARWAQFWAQRVARGCLSEWPEDPKCWSYV
jgi:hypothetical protein